MLWHGCLLALAAAACSAQTPAGASGEAAKPGGLDAVVNEQNLSFCKVDEEIASLRMKLKLKVTNHTGAAVRVYKKFEGPALRTMVAATAADLQAEKLVFDRSPSAAPKSTIKQFSAKSFATVAANESYSLDVTAEVFVTFTDALPGLPPPGDYWLKLIFATWPVNADLLQVPAEWRKDLWVKDGETEAIPIKLPSPMPEKKC